jgi:membrane associated rhomboid family serine protease
MTILLIATNICISLYQWLAPGSLNEQLISAAGFIPARLTGLAAASPGLPPVLTLVTSQFLHGGVFHLGGNMLFLWIFGNNVEDEMGSIRFLAFYLLCGVFAGFVHYATGPASPVPAIGASGAISGVLGAYALMFPKARIHTLLILFLFITVVRIPAIIWVGLWLVIQLVQGIASYGAGSGVAWFAHIGGLLGGIVLLFFFRPKRPRPTLGPFSGTWVR